MIKTTGSQLFIFDGTEIINVGCVSSIGDLPATRDSQDDTALGDEFKSVQHTTITLGDVAFGIVFDSASYEHLKIRTLFLNVAPITAFIGLSETDDPPQLVNGDVELPPNRTWIKFKSRVWSYPLSLPAEGVAQVNFSLRIDEMPAILFAGGTMWNGDIKWNGGLLWR